MACQIHRRNGTNLLYLVYHWKMIQWFGNITNNQGCSCGSMFRITEEYRRAKQTTAQEVRKIKIKWLSHFEMMFHLFGRSNWTLTYKLLKYISNLKSSILTSSFCWLVTLFNEPIIASNLVSSTFNGSTKNLHPSKCTPSRILIAIWWNSGWSWRLLRW